MTRLKKKKSICHGSVLSSGQSNTVILYEERRGRDKNRKKKNHLGDSGHYHLLKWKIMSQFSYKTALCSVVSNSLWPYGL